MRKQSRTIQTMVSIFASDPRTVWWVQGVLTETEQGKRTTEQPLLFAGSSPLAWTVPECYRSASSSRPSVTQGQERAKNFVVGELAMF